MRRLSHPLRYAALATVAAVALSACTREGLGAETAGRTGIAAAKGFNVTLFPEAERRPAPRFRGPALVGAGTIDEGFVRGRVAVINVWGSWCGPCRREQPALERLWKQYGPRGVRFLGIDVRDARANALAYIEEFGVTYPSVFDPSSAVAFKFRVIFAPVTYVVDRRGRIAARIVGALRSEEDLTRLLDEELAAP